MKSRASSPHTSPQVLKRYLVESSPSKAAPPTTPRQSSLHVVELPSITAMSTFAPFASAPSNSPAAPSNGRLTPIPAASRKASGGFIPSATPPRSDSLGAAGPTPSPAAVSPLSAGAENSPAPWSTAVGHATTSGKSGRVIERLMNENDKLKRDLNEQVVRCQELEKTLQTYKPQIEALRQENDNLTHARDVDSNLISRRDRRIEELKAELALQKKKSEAAESLARLREREKEDAEEKAYREVQSMTESTKHATIHADILETSHRQLAAEYRARAEAWKKDITTINDQRARDRKKLARIDVVTDQMRQELERSRKLNAEIIEAWERLRDEQDARLQGIEDANDREQELSRNLSAEMEKVVNQMKWLMGVQKNRDADANAKAAS